MVTRPEVVALVQNGSRLDRDDGARRLGTPTALQLLSPLDDAIAIAASWWCANTHVDRKKNKGVKCGVAFEGRAESEAAIKNTGAGMGISKCRPPLAAISA
jgi:hypothetical protein